MFSVTVKTSPVAENGDDMMTDGGPMLHKVKACGRPLVIRRPHETVRGISGGAAAERGAAGDVRREGVRRWWRGSKRRPKREGRAAEETVKVLPWVSKEAMTGRGRANFPAVETVT